MRRKLTRRNRNTKKNKIIIISTMCLLFCLCVGYAAFQTNISITAKGNVVCKGTPAKELLLEDLTTSGDGLYIDNYETDGDRYVFRGTSPSNYITFNNETWRIIAIEADGTLKIIRNSHSTIMGFDSKGLRTTGYCAYSSYGCNAWAATDNFNNGSYSGSVDKDSEILTYLNSTYYSSLTDEAQSYIVSHNFNIGAVTYGNTDMSAQIAEEKAYKWNGKVGLITVSDYILANGDQENCGTFSNWKDEGEDCVISSKSWMHPNSGGIWWWTITPYASNTSYVYYIDTEAFVTGSDSFEDRYVRPVVFLKSSIYLTGEGTQSNPYEITCS